VTRVTVAPSRVPRIAPSLFRIATMRMSLSLVSLLFAALLAGCGGGSGGGPEGGTGRVTLLVGDGPIDDLAEAWITVREVRLVMSGGKDEVVLDVPQKIELLGLRNLTEVLLMEEIVSGRVNKIRLLLDDLEVVREDGTRDVLDVPAGGWIDLNPQGGIEVRAGETITVFIDVDLARSVHVVAGGNGRMQFRPQVFVELLSAGDPSRLVRLKGIARGVNPTTDTWDLCDLRRESGDGSPENLVDCVHVDDAGSAVFANGAELADGVTVTAFGYMDFAAAEDTMDAEVLVTGTAKPIVPVDGTVTALTASPPSIGIDTDPTAATSLVTANLVSGARLIPRAGTTGAPAVSDVIEAFGFATGAPTTVDAFLAVYARP
jgi:hypothetical protein